MTWNGRESRSQIKFYRTNISTYIALKYNSLLSHLINTNVRCMPLFQWFYDVELCMDMNTSYNNTNRLFPLGNCSMHRLKRLLLVLYHRHPCRRPGGRGSKWDSSEYNSIAVDSCSPMATRMHAGLVPAVTVKILLPRHAAVVKVRHNNGSRSRCRQVSYGWHASLSV